MNGKANSPFRNLRATLDGVSAPSGSLWKRMEHAALEKGALDKVDLALIRTLCRRAGRPDDLAFQTVQACLLSAVRAGGLRIPLDPAGLAIRLEELLSQLLPAPETSLPVADANPFADPVSSAESLTSADARTLSVRLAGEFDRQRRDGLYDPVIGIPPQFLPLLHIDGGLYFQRHQAAEASVGTRLARLLSAPDMGSPEDPGNALDTVLRKLPLRLSSSPDSPAMEFDALQREALALALRKRFTVISGGPGTGKTSLAANLLRAWTLAWLERNAESSDGGDGGSRPRIRLAAPTGRAAQRLAESLRRSLESVRYGSADGAMAGDGEMKGDQAMAEARGMDAFVSALPCETLHTLLRYNPGTGEFFHQRHRRLPADLVVIDEVSMVDIFTLARLLEALEDGACLVLIGDMDQLPSVDSGSVLADLVPTDGGNHPLRDNLVILERSHRSEAAILDVTRRINAMDGAGALAAMPPPLSLSSARNGIPGSERDPIWPITFLQDGRKVSSQGGCRMLSPPNGRDQAADYRAGWDAWLEAWVDFHYLDHALDPARYPGRTLATPRRASYASLVEELCAYQPPGDALFHAGLAWKTAPSRLREDRGNKENSASTGSPASPDPDFLKWMASLDELFSYLDQARILTLTRKGWHGAVSVNRRIRERLIRRWDPGARPDGTEGFNGSPILILENDHSKGLYNGDVGVLLRLGGRSMSFFRRADAYLAFPAPFLPRHESAFAMTVHKSQGSEYDQALLVLPESGNRLLYKETLYTALTRARYFAGIYGPAGVFMEAVGRKVVRESGLPASLRALARP
ncbi:MAG: recD [Fibrobacteres bacterium]|nr:recD [Fibrobacterota bacterium]